MVDKELQEVAREEHAYMCTIKENAYNPAVLQDRVNALMLSTDKYSYELTSLKSDLEVSYALSSLQVI